MKVKLLPRIISDDNQELKEKDLVLVKIKNSDTKHSELAQINDIQMTIITLTFNDSLEHSGTHAFRVSDIESLEKYYK